MICSRCGVETVIYRQVNASGAKVVVERCPICRTNPRMGQAFLPKKDYEWDSLPLFDDYSKHAEPCAVKGCANVGTEWNHWMPRHLSDEADDWPGAWLCAQHHREWHEKTQTGSYAKRSNHGQHVQAHPRQPV